jgi:hypothetical protein
LKLSSETEELKKKLKYFDSFYLLRTIKQYYLKSIDVKNFGQNKSSSKLKQNKKIRRKKANWQETNEP